MQRTCIHIWKDCKRSDSQFTQYQANYLHSGLGYKRDDPSTVSKATLPVINEKGMCMHYCVGHEDFVWNVRSEPGVIDAFEKVYDDKDLIVSFDAVNFALPK